MQGPFATLPENLLTNELAKFELDQYGNVTIRTTSSNALVKVGYDYIAATYPDTVTEVYTYKVGGATGSVVATVTVVYTDATKENLVSVAVV